MRCDGWPAKNKYIFSFTGGLSAYRAHKAARVVSVCIIMCCGAVFAQNQPARTVCCCTHFWHSARAQNTYECQMETHTHNGTQPATRAFSLLQHLFISQYYCFHPATRHQVAVKFAFCVTQQLCGRRFRPILLVNWFFNLAMDDLQVALSQ